MNLYGVQLVRVILKRVVVAIFQEFLSKVLRTNSTEDLNSVRRAFKRYFADMVRPNASIILLSILFMAIFSATNAGMAWIIKPIINNVFVDKELESLNKIGMFIIILSCLKGISLYIYTNLLFIVSVKVMAKIRNTLYKSFITQDLSFHHKNSPGSLVSVAMNELNSINTLVTDIPINVGRDLFTFLGILILMFFQNYVYASLILLSVIVIILPVKIIGKKVKESFKKTNKGLGDLTSHLEQTLNGIREVKSYNKETVEQLKVEGIVNSIAKIQRRVNRISSLLPAVMEVISGITIGSVLIYAGYQVIYHDADAGTFFSFIVALIIAYQPLKRLSDFTVKIQLGALAVKRYYYFVDLISEIKEVDNPVHITHKPMDIEFKNVDFSYNIQSAGSTVKTNKAVDGMSFKILSGQKVALVGRSGGGKSTIINLIARFYDPISGQIFIDSKDIKTISIKSLRENVSIVSQEVVLFDDTILANIAYSRENTTEEQIALAAKNAACFDFINTLPDKFNTLIGPRGAKLSGGQRQRVSIARALLKNSPILLLDEATSALDTESEKEIQEALNKLMENKTTLIIAHRLSTILNCDKIFVVDNGKIIEQGSNEELLAKDDSLYKYLYDLQFKNQENT